MDADLNINIYNEIHFEKQDIFLFILNTIITPAEFLKWNNPLPIFGTAHSHFNFF